MNMNVRYASEIIEAYTKLGWTFNHFADKWLVAKDGALIQLMEMSNEEKNLTAYTIAIFDDGTNYMTCPWSYEVAKEYFSRVKAQHNATK